MHLSELNDDGDSWPWGCREAELGKGVASKVGDAGRKSRGRGALATVMAEREGRGTSMSLTTSVEARGGNSRVAGHGGTRKQSWGRGPPVTSAIPGSRVATIGDAGKKSRGRRRTGNGQFWQPDAIVCKIHRFLRLQYVGLCSI
jgi:hypothetical protein